MKTKFLVLLVFGAALALFLTSEKGEEVREDLSDKADKWKKKFNKLAADTGIQLEDLKELVSKEIQGLENVAREKILGILDEGNKSAGKVKDKIKNQVS